MTGEAITCCLIVDVSAGRAAFLLAVTLQTELGGRRGKQLYAGHVLADAHFVTAEAVFLRGRMRILVLRLILVTSNAGRRIDIGIQHGRMLLCRRGNGQERGGQNKTHEG